MKRTYGLIAAGFLIAIVLLLIKVFYINQTAEPAKISVSQTPAPTLKVEKTVDYKAKFAIYINGTKRIFTNSMYHNLSKDVYIEASDPSMVHVKKDGKTWMDFFMTLPMKLDKDCIITGTKETFCMTKNSTLKFYLNDVKNDKLLFEKIKDNDLALISYGTENETQLKSQLNSLKKP
ncbi:MAG: hypothetical protein A3E40_04465 [Candidatus Levybacteria bacterium RIFCSPHIGHO2_12_FULL_37_9]|nr:MAG: hypothetical protein A3E40_04465 [Candidatus Levybacteria bacterium RIFCSPHIGHO2_12_FULL_37_9]